MPCYHPLRARRNEDGTVSPTRKVDEYDDFEFSEPLDPLRLACGQCLGCRMDKARDWQLRAMHEAKLHFKNSFVTLTYDEKHLPEDRSLEPSELQKFLKRVRYHHGKFRYMAVGEYGPQTNRPHYHLLVFGLDFLEDAFGYEDNLWVSHSLSKRWKYGMHTIGSLTPETAGYVARYTLKKQTGRRAPQATQRTDPDTGECWEVEPEFFFQSRNPGIGNEWFKRFKGDCYPSDHLVDHNGKKTPVPRYYDYLLDREDPEALAEVKDTRQDFEKPKWAQVKAQEKTLKSRARLFGNGSRTL